MNKSEVIFSRLKKNRLVALLTPRTVEECITAYEILDPYGVVLEIAWRSEVALEGMKAIVGKFPDALILAGTIMTRFQAEAAIKAGVAGVISADYIPSVVETCVKNNIMCVPGGLSDAGKQLAYKSELSKCDLNELRGNYPWQWTYKLFPAFSGARSNIDLVSAWRGPFKHLTVFYTGGVNSENIKSLVRHDPEGIYCGSALTSYIDDPGKMKSEVERWVGIVQGKGTEKTMRVSREGGGEGEAPKVVTLGKIMLRLSPPNAGRFIQANRYDAAYGGAEANAAVSIANYGLESCFVTALPDSEVGQGGVNALRAFGVDTRYILRQVKRIGIYFLEYGASQRPSKVIYDRAGSSFSDLKPGQIDWEEVFRGVAWFHWSGITPAVSDSAAEVTLEALRAAKKSGVTVSVDLNYRKKLWSKEKARSIMTNLMGYVDICIGNEEDVENIFGIRAESEGHESGELVRLAYKGVSAQLIEKFGFSKAAITLRESITASDNIWSACLHNGTEFLLSREYPIHIVDRVGGGDAFSSGLIYGMITGKTDQEALEFGAAASCLKHTIHGDFNLVSVGEVEELVSGKGRGRILR